jgi:glycosyltransferase involved in cell wall biosynthesis
MFDAIGSVDHGFVSHRRDLKIISFCKMLHDQFVSLGLESLYMQYFPKPAEFTPGQSDQVFFWQRLTQINVNTVARLFTNASVKIHVHKAVDPYHSFVSPDSETENKFQVTYSEWFENKNQLLDLIKSKGVYVAPREREGIGMSFLEAMAMGKAVIACDNPTMNEYIENGKTGYLFDLKNPHSIDISNIREVQKNTYAYMKDGYGRWLAERGKIIDFLRKE